MKVFHGVYDAAGQAWETVKAEREIGQSSKLVLFNKSSLGYGYDQFVDVSSIRNPIHRKLKKVATFINLLPRYDIFHFYRSQSLLSDFKDLPILKMFNKKIIMHFFGSEVRRLDMARKYKFHYADDMGFDPKEESKKSERIDFIKKYVDVMIVPDYEVLEYVPTANIVPLTYDAKLISKIKTKFSTGKKIKILHAPSNRIIKDTDFVIETINKLKENLLPNYLVDFQLVEGINHEQAIKRYAEADIIVDQLRLGMYATLSIESMALGKPAVCYIRDDVAAKYPNLPILNTNKNNLKKNLRVLIENKDLRLKLGMEGTQYASKVHHPLVIAKQLEAIYRNLYH